jgi:hypothetical protein
MDMKRIGYVLILVLFMVGIGFAMQDGDAPAEEKKAFDWNNLWQMALLGAFTTAFLGKAKKGDFIFWKDLKPKKMILKGIVGLVIGIVASLKGISLADAQGVVFGGDLLVVGMLLTFGLDYLIRTIFKGVVKSGKALVDSIQNAAKPNEPTS